MSYSAIGLIAAVILVIISHDVLFKYKNERPFAAQNQYRRFLFAVLAYYTTDILWGWLDKLGWKGVLFADTVVYFAAMAFAIFFWTQFVTSYLQENNPFNRILRIIGWAFVCFELAVLVVNFFKPLMFSYNDAGEYVPGPLRHVTLVMQITLFLLSSIHTLMTSMRSRGSAKRRHRTIGLFCIAEIILIVFQIFYPLLPLYSVGFLVGTCLLYVYVIQDEKEEYRRKLEHALDRERKHQKELGSTRKLAYTDPLTGVKNKLSYAEAEDRLQTQINAGKAPVFAIAVFDLNGLKLINDTKGHDAGDKYIVDSCRTICRIFEHSPVFRIGGDEFTAILEGNDYESRFELMKLFDRQIEENLRYGGAVVASGMAQFDPDLDVDCMTVFKRADRNMYERKDELKKMGEEFCNQNA